jgi:hypothetical protein
MNNIQEMLKAIILAGRDEGYMEPGDNASATAEILVIFSGYDQAYDEDEDEEVDDLNSEIYEIYINANALEPGFCYADPEEILGIEVEQKDQIHIRAVYEVDKGYIHMNSLEEYVDLNEGLSLAAITNVIQAAYQQVTD